MRGSYRPSFYGAGNFGDDIMLAGFLTVLSDKDVKIHLTLQHAIRY
jgi:polysaccharide pyruvyl transferase WcaK-like protein